MKTTEFVRPIILSIVLALSAWTGSAQAAAINLTEIVFEFDASPWTLGWTFTVSEPYTVGALGVYDSGQDGLAVPAQVGLWLASGGNPLAQTTVPSGAASELDGHFRFASIAPTLLIPGTEYLVGSYLSDGLATSLFGGNGTVDPSITVVDARYSLEGGGFAFPGLTDPGSEGTALLGANVRPIPLPTAVWLFGSGIAGLAGLAGLARRQTAMH